VLTSVISGILIASQPGAGLLTMVWLIGIYAIVFDILFMRTSGARHIFITVPARRGRRQLRRPERSRPS
jgi:hypothetical protein